MASVLTICSLCVFQYVSVVLPMNKSLTNLSCLVMVLCAWIISIFFATGPAIRNGGAINSLQTFSTVYIITLQTEQIFPTTLPWCFAVIYFLVCSVAWTPIAHGSDVIHLASTGRRCSRFFGNETAFDNVNFGSDISGLLYSVFRLVFFFKDLDHPPDFWGISRFGLITCIAHAIFYLCIQTPWISRYIERYSKKV